ncbi:hypothetical protein lbkm_2494 [Lachnospiraceae bacterium KM106-2]|nr:hypothetical protein lbkm_2494 [Lachnospiraceae bacterium KM106-2]
MDIPALSMAMSQINTSNAIGVCMLKKSMDNMEISGANMTKILEQSVTPNLGGNVDIKL